MKYCFALGVSIVLFLAAVLSAAPIGFNRDVRPILSENCFPCHGPDKNARQAGLRLDRREEAVAKGAIEPGKPDESKLVARIRAKQEALRMPPVWANKQLTEEQKGALAEWIGQGAEYEPHWAYIPPERPDAPDRSNAIDYFVERQLEESGLHPVDEAGHRTLARRLSFDLTGLPPKPEVVDAFVRDKKPDAYKNLLDQFLASPHFGERMAVHWLDLVRYADTVGFHGDVAVNVYPFRDYVIRSFNNNKPFDEFTREQLGGDLIPNATIEQKVASAYNRLSRMTNEGGAQAKEYLAKYAADRARTTATVWLGSTMGCAECHDHKFDPFSTEDFYALQAFFADIEEEGVFEGFGDWGAKIQAPSFQAQEEIARIDSRIASLRAGGKGGLPPGNQNLKQFASQLRDTIDGWRVLEPSALRGDCSDPNVEGCETFELEREGDGFVRLKPKGELKALTVVEEAEVSLEPGRISALMIEVFKVENSMDFFLAEFQVRMSRDGQTPRRAGIKSFVPDWEGPGVMLRGSVDGNHHTGWGGDPCEEGTRRAVFVFDQEFEVAAGDRLFVTTIFDRIFGLKGFALRHRLWGRGRDAGCPAPPAQIRT